MNDQLTVAWYDFEPEPDITGDGSGDPDTHYLTIAVVERDGSKGDEIAVICHRTCDGKYPIDGILANEKRRHAQTVVDALNHQHGPGAGYMRTYADQLAWQRETATCRHCDRPIVKTDEGWIDPEAGYDDENDGIWRVTCDRHDTFVAEHEPKEA